MKKNLFKTFCSLLLSVLFFSGCRKEIQEEPITDTNPGTESRTRDDNGGDRNECRLTNLTYFGGEGEYNYHYNRKGLCDQWDIKGTGLFRQVYDANGRLKISKWYDGTELLATIHFFYERNRVVKEIWYNGNTSEIGDEVFYTYNSRGQMVRGESFMNDYYTVTTWTHDGNTATWKFFLGGNPYYAGYLTYYRPVKNPYLAVPGIEYGFPFVNPTYNMNKRWATSEKLVLYDESGEPTVLFDYDPRRTVWQVGRQNYPLSTTYFDRVSQGWFPYTFEYENCGGRNDENDSRIDLPPSKAALEKINPMMLLKYNPSKSIKEQAREIRKQVAEMKRNK